MIATLCGAIAGFVGVSVFLAVGGPLGVMLGVLVATTVLTATTRWW